MRVQIHFKDGSSTDVVECEYPLGHRFRRDEAIPQINRKFSSNITDSFSQKQMKNIQEVCLNSEKLSSMPVNEFMDLFFNLKEGIVHGMDCGSTFITNGIGQSF